MKNDPRYDPYPIPLEILTEARRWIRQGATVDRAAADVVRLLDLCAEREPATRQNVNLFKLNIVQRHIVIEDRLTMTQDDLIKLKGRFRCRDNYANRTPEEAAEARKKHAEYMRNYRKKRKTAEPL